MGYTVPEWTENEETAFGRPPIYPWYQWMNGEVWILTKGEDFYSELVSFRVHCHKMARQYGLKVKTKFEEGDKIRITFYEEGEKV